jgi:small GTP-binding protein
MKTVELQQQEKIMNTIINLKEQLQSAGDHQTKDKLDEILKKWEKNELNIGFCGHFSAGKSTMINQLLGKQLLPASPIPTSANLVMIREGKPRAEISFTDGEKIDVDVSNIEKWKEYCKNGQEVEKVEIFDENPLLDQQLQLLDTPGIDSTDSAHQSATEAALHLADVIIFVTDYNHVQSEVNFNFIKSLKEKGKILLLVINQIDKHREQELSLSLFQERVTEGLKEWGITLDGLLFTSMKYSEHPYNQFQELERVIEKIKSEKLHLITAHFLEAIKVLLEEHGQFLRDQQQGMRENIEKYIVDLKMKAKWDENPMLLTEVQLSQSTVLNWREEFLQKLDKILNNAMITPYTTTQLAQELIESYQKDFKVGWLFAGKKTDEERLRRHDALFQDLNDRVTAQIEWHVKELARKQVEQYHIEDRDFQSEVINWTLPIPKDWLTDLIKTDTVSREFVYHYTGELTRKITQLYRNYVESFITKGQDLLQEKHIKRFEPEEERLQLFQSIEKQQEKIEQLEDEVTSIITKYQKSLIDLYAGENSSYHFQYKYEDLSTYKPSQGQVIEHNREEGSVDVGQRNSIVFNQEALQQVAGQLKKAADLLAEVPTLSPLVQEFRDKAERLDKNRFTVCLFGAFSAGKSSFANALLGESVLPVSPNPTTAAINQVLPATEENPSGTAMIKMKARSQVEEEIQLSLKRLQLSTAKSVLENLQQIDNVKPFELRPSLKPYYSFLQACYKGWEEAQDLLDNSFKVTEEQYSEYVAVERKACYVESIQLFHGSYLTNNGVELIDTPGADSIYSRHTNVTFNYIKNADVILYVTYYNHAFSRADRDFLDQLGRVKDQFALDKMFFMVNASDLAESKDELDGVVVHVEQNLLQSGIRFPRIFPISSLKALEGQADSGMENFEASFFSFIQEDLTQLLVESGQRDLEKAYMLLSEMKRDLESSVEFKQKKITELENKTAEWIRLIEEEAYPGYFKEIEKETKEHLFYVKQRLFFNFQKHINEAFHPSVLTAEQHGKTALLHCLDELLFSTLYQLREELKATTLRLEKHTYRLLDRALTDWQRRTDEEGISLQGKSIDREGFDLPHIPKQFGEIDRRDLDRTLLHFKNPKHFFEQGGKDNLRQEFEQKWVPIVDAYITVVEDTFTAFYQKNWKTVELDMKKALTDELKIAISSKLSALRGDIQAKDVEKLIVQYNKEVLQ